LYLSFALEISPGIKEGMVSSPPKIIHSLEAVDAHATLIVPTYETAEKTTKVMTPR
jgi:hypothetical protein